MKISDIGECSIYKKIGFYILSYNISYYTYILIYQIIYIYIIILG